VTVGYIFLKRIRRSYPSDTTVRIQTVIGKRGGLSFNKDAFASPLPLVYSSDRTMGSPSFCMPSPSAPSATYHSQIGQTSGSLPYSPVSPSPSFFRHGSPPSILSPYDEREMYAEQSTTIINLMPKRRAPRPGTQFDSNNIRYIPRLEPCVPESTVKLYNEPKLSPVLGSIIPPSSGDRSLFPVMEGNRAFHKTPGSCSRTLHSRILLPLLSHRNGVGLFMVQTNQPRRSFDLDSLNRPTNTET
jgi:hypothetical protein